MRTNWRSLLRSFLARCFVRRRQQPVPPVVSPPVTPYVTVNDDDADIADAWLALEAMTDATLTRAEVEDTLFVEAKYRVMFGLEYIALLQKRRNYLAALGATQGDEEQGVAS